MEWFWDGSSNAFYLFGLVTSRSTPALAGCNEPYVQISSPGWMCASPSVSKDAARKFSMKAHFFMGISFAESGQMTVESDGPLHVCHGSLWNVYWLGLQGLLQRAKDISFHPHRESLILEDSPTLLQSSFRIESKPLPRFREPMDNPMFECGPYKIKRQANEAAAHVTWKTIPCCT